jgi:hypothetical protein
LWPDDGPPNFGLPEHSPLTWEGERERAWMATWNIVSGRVDRYLNQYWLFVGGFTLLVLLVGVGFWLFG